MENSANLRKNFEAVAQIMGRVLPLIEHVPDSMGKWIPPIKAAVRENQKMVASIALAGSASKALKGKLSLTDAVMVGFSAHSLGASKKMSVLAGAGAFAASAITKGFRSASKEAVALQNKTAAATRSLSAAARIPLPRTSAAAGGSGSASGRKSSSGSASFFGVNPALLLAGGALAGGVKLSGMVKRVMDFGGALNDLSTKTGIAVDQIMILQQAAKQSGVGDIAGVVNKLGKNLIDVAADGASPAAAALDRLGLSAQQLIRDTPVGALQKIGDRINAIENPALRAATAMQLFGKSGAELLPLFADPSALGTAAASLGRQAEVMKQNAAAFQTVADRLNRSGLKMQGFSVGVAKGLLPALDKFTAKFDKVDLVGQGERFAKAMMDAGTEFAKGFNTANIQGGMDLVKGIAGVLGKGLGKAVEFGSGVGKGAQALIGSAKQGTLMKDMLGAVVGGGVAHAGDAKLNRVLEARLASIHQRPPDRKALTPWKAVHAWDMKSSASRLGSSGVLGASMATNQFTGSGGRDKFIFQRTDLQNAQKRSVLPAAERRAFEDAMFAETGKRPTLGGAYGTVRRGDAAARKEAARAAERKKNEDKLSVARSNQLLEKVVGVLEEGLL